MHFDGLFTLKGDGAGVVLTSPISDILRYVVQLYFQTTNNTTEYEGLLSGMRASSILGIKRLLAIGDSLLVVNQVQKKFQCSDLTIVAYLTEVRRLERRFIGFEVKPIRREDNFLANEMARLASSRKPILVGVFKERLSRPSTTVLGQSEGDVLLRNGAPEPTPLEATPPSMPSTSDGHHVVALLDSGMT